MNVFITLLTVIEVIVCVLLSLLVLMQRPRQEGLGAAFGSGVTDQMFGAQTTNVLQKATVYLGIALFGLTFLLAILISRQSDRTTGKDTFIQPTDKVAIPAAGGEAGTPSSPEEAIRKAIEQAAGKAPAEDKAPPAPAPSTPAPAAPAGSKPAPPTPSPPPTGAAKDKPSTPAPTPAASTPVPAVPAPLPTAPAPAK